jgi:hypothetical protein
MRRSITVLSAFAVLAAMIGMSVSYGQRGSPRPQPGSTDKANPKVESDKPLADNDPAAALAHRARFPGINDPKATLEDGLQFLTKTYHVTFDINDRAFKSEGIADVAHSEIFLAELPAADNVRLDVILKRILRRVPVPSGATFMVRSDGIEITTNAFVKTEVWGDDFDGPLLPLVQLRAEKLPLSEALAQLAEQGRLNIVFSASADKASTPVTLRLSNVPVDTAVRLLALHAGLSLVHRDNVLVVTTPENAATLTSEYRSETPDPNSKWRRGSGQPPATTPPAAM